MATKNKQESNTDYFELAREIAKEEKALGIEHWDLITICRDGDKEGEYIHLYSYDLPRKIADRYDWVIRWRTAKLQCQYPRYQVRCYHSPYRKVCGKNIGMQEDLRHFIAAKAQVSRKNRQLNEYIQAQKESNMFFDETRDENIIALKNASLLLKKV